MIINSISKIPYSSYRYTSGNTKKTLDSANSLQVYNNQNQNIPAEYYRASLCNLSFGARAPQINRAIIISDQEDDIPLMITKKRNSYIIEFDSQTEMIYGIHAQKFLNSNSEFEYDTQVIFPKNSQGILHLENGKTIKMNQGSVAIIKAGTKANFEKIKGYPAVIMSKQDYSWYEHYNKNSQNTDIRNKYLELMYYNSFSYNGNFSPDVILPHKLRNEKYLKNLGIDQWQSKNQLIYKLFDIKDKLPQEDAQIVETAKSALDKLFALNIIERTPNGYISVKKAYNSEYLAKFLKDNGFSDDESAVVMPILIRSRQTRIDSKITIANPADKYRQDLIPRLKQANIFLNTKKNLDTVYWSVLFPNETMLRNKLKEIGFNQEEEDSVVKSWLDTNLTGYDVSGLKYIDNDVAVYNLNDKMNNWTQEETNWLTNSTELSTNSGHTPFIGASFVNCDNQGIYSIDTIRKGETLHSHPGLEDKKQTEIYLITEGACALTVVKDNNPKIKILKEGDLVVVGPRVKHCINSIRGKYEHIAVQVPSAFQYGFSFKRPEDFPTGYDPSVLDIEAKEKLGVADI